MSDGNPKKGALKRLGVTGPRRDMLSTLRKSIEETEGSPLEHKPGVVNKPGSDCQWRPCLGMHTYAMPISNSLQQLVLKWRRPTQAIKSRVQSRIIVFVEAVINCQRRSQHHAHQLIVRMA